MSFAVAVVGATGNVGQEMLRILAEREFPISRIHAVASDRSTGKELSYGDNQILRAEPLSSFDFSGIDFVFSSPGAKVSAEFAPRAAAKGAIIIDNTSYFRMDPDVPLVVPEVNPQALDGFRTRNIIANPNCSTIQMVTALKPIHDRVGIRRISVATYQSVSGAGKEAMDELFEQTRAMYVGDPPEAEILPKRIAFNLIPQIDVFMEDGMTKEEWKMVVETKKILDPRIKVMATCVRVPVFIGHSEAVHLELDGPLDPEEAREILREAPGVMVIDRPEEDLYATPVEIAGEDDVAVSRIRVDPTVEHGLAMWIVGDNLRKGAALNAVQIAETLIARGLVTPRAEAA